MLDTERLSSTATSLQGEFSPITQSSHIIIFSELKDEFKDLDYSGEIEESIDIVGVSNSPYYNSYAYQMTNSDFNTLKQSIHTFNKQFS